MVKHLQILPTAFSCIVMGKESKKLSYTKSIEKILELSNEMILCAINSEWDKVETLELERQSVIGVLSLPDETNAEVEESVRSIVELNERIVSMGSVELSARMSEVSRIKNNKKGIKVYENI